MTDPSTQEQQPCDLTLFVACYNEAGNIVGALDVLRDALGEFQFTYEIIVIDDGSRDNSVEVVREYMQRYPAAPISLVVNPENRGVAYNFIEGAFLGHGTYYRMVCGDDVEPKEALVDTFSKIGQADVVLSYHTCHTRSQFREVVSKAFTFLVNVITGYRLKYYNGLPIFKRRDVMRWHSYSSGFGFQADVVARLLDNGATYVEVPVPAHERATGKSTALTFRNFCSVAHLLWELAVRRVSRALFGKRTAKPSSK